MDDGVHRQPREKDHVSLRVKRALKRRDPLLVPQGGTAFTDAPEGGQGRFLKVNREEWGWRGQDPVPFTS